MLVHSFAPIARADARILILGSMPGKESLRTGQYYAHGRNLFWRIVDELFDIPASLAYQQRCARLVDEGVAVWDVLASCQRDSSLDADILAGSMVVNDFDAFFRAHPTVKAIYFNGAKAQDVYRKRVLPGLPPPHCTLPATRLPSTSPANAALGFEAKLASWASIALDGPMSCGGHSQS